MDASSGDSELTGAPGLDECESVISEAEFGPPPQDIIMVVDNSDSMVDEAGFARAELNDFSALIGAAEVDAHIILMTSLPSVPAGICIDPPLGSGGCPSTDTNPPAFVHIDTRVGSRDALTRIFNLYPDYAEFLRPSATTHIVVISDDDTDRGPGTFLDDLVQLDPRFYDVRFHAIVASDDPGDACLTGSACCEYATTHGSRYEQIVAMTGGVLGDLCEQEFQPVFEALAQEVIEQASLPCAIEIPAPPDGQSFDRDRVNVGFDDGTGETIEFGRVDASSQCQQVSDGWFYDDAQQPSEVVLCQQTCERVQGLAQAEIGIVFGCATIPAG